MPDRSEMMPARHFAVEDDMERDFAAVLASYRQRSGLSQHRLAQATGANRSTISLLESGGRHPTREFVLQLARALTLTAAEADELLVAARHSPTIFSRLSPADPDLRLVFHILAGDGIPDDKRCSFRQLLRGAAGLCGLAATAESIREECHA
jgi:transcriptional regulator with XRE-family HTH domain